MKERIKTDLVTAKGKDSKSFDPSELDWPSESGMKVVIPVRAMKRAIRQSCLAALTDEGQSEIVRAVNETRGCVRISATNDAIVFESAVSSFQCRHVLQACDGIVVIENGETCVPAKELILVSNALFQGADAVSLSFASKAIEPETSTNILSKIPDGLLGVSMVRGNKIMTTTKIESYPTTEFLHVENPSRENVQVVLSIKAGAFKRVNGHLSVAINPDGYNEVVNKVAIFDGGEVVYFVGTDTRRCAVVPVKKSDLEKSSDFLIEENGKHIPILIDAVYLNPILAALDDNDVVTIATEETDEHLYIICGKTSYRITRLDKTLALKYPNYCKLLSMPIGSVISLDRQDCKSVVDALHKSNKDRISLIFDENESAIRVFAKSDPPIMDAFGTLPYRQVSEQLLKQKTFVLHTDYLRRGLNHIQTERVMISFSQEETKVRLESFAKREPKFIFFIQAMRPL